CRGRSNLVWLKLAWKPSVFNGFGKSRASATLVPPAGHSAAQGEETRSANEMPPHRTLASHPVLQCRYERHLGNRHWTPPLDVGSLLNSEKHPQSSSRL